jgi:hypothetical protein
MLTFAKKTVQLSKSVRIRGMADGGCKIYRNGRGFNVVWLSKAERQELINALLLGKDQELMP